MERYNADWYKARGREKWEREKGRRNGIVNAISRDLVELEVLKDRLLREAKMEQKKYSRAS